MSDQSFHLADPSRLQMIQLLFGLMATQAISMAAKLGIADLVREAPKTASFHRATFYVIVRRLPRKTAF